MGFKTKHILLAHELLKLQQYIVKLLNSQCLELCTVIKRESNITILPTVSLF